MSQLERRPEKGMKAFSQKLTICRGASLSLSCNRAGSEASRTAQLSTKLSYLLKL